MGILVFVASMIYRQKKPNVEQERILKVHHKFIRAIRKFVFSLIFMSSKMMRFLKILKIYIYSNIVAGNNIRNCAHYYR